MQGPGTHPVNTTPAPVTEGVVYELTAPASGSAALHWEVEVSAGDETWTERDGFGIDGKQPATDAIAGAGVSVRVWRAPADGVARFSVVIDGTATVTAATVAGRTGRVVLTVPGDILAENIMASGGLIAGDPNGARVVINADGVVAFDSSGTETAQITGEGGEFVGGEFRTSDTLPGQITMSDTANAGTPGLSIEPEDSAGYDVLPSIGPGPTDMWISGGVSTDGTMSGANFNANGTSIYHNGPGENGAGAWSAVNSSGVEMRYRTNRSQLTPQSLIRAYDGSAQVVADGGEGTFSVIGANSGYAGVTTERPEGLSAVRTNTVLAEIEYRTGAFSRKLTVDATGVWVTTGSRSYNLLETAQDSDWQTFGLEAGVTGSSAVAWRNKGGVIYFRGFVTGDWTTGVWNTIASGLNPEWLPSESWVVAEAGGATKGATLQMTADGRLRISPPVTSSTSYYLNAMTYPAG